MDFRKAKLFFEISGFLLIGEYSLTIYRFVVESLTPVMLLMSTEIGPYSLPNFSQQLKCIQFYKF